MSTESANTWGGLVLCVALTVEFFRCWGADITAMGHFSDVIRWGLSVTKEKYVFDVSTI